MNKGKEDRSIPVQAEWWNVFAGLWDRTSNQARKPARGFSRRRGRPRACGRKWEIAAAVDRELALGWPLKQAMGRVMDWKKARNRFSSTCICEGRFSARDQAASASTPTGLMRLKRFFLRPRWVS